MTMRDMDYEEFSEAIRQLGLFIQVPVIASGRAHDGSTCSFEDPSLSIAASCSMPSRSKTARCGVNWQRSLRGELATFVAKMAKDGERKFEDGP